MLCAKCAPRNSGLLIRWAAVQRTAPPVWTFCSMCLSPLCVYNIPNWDEGYNRDFDNVAMETQILGKVFCQPSTKQVQIQSGCFWAIIQCAFHCSIWNVQEFFRFFNLPFTIAFKTAADWRWPKKSRIPFSRILEIRFCSVYLAWNASETSAGTVLLRHICMYGSYKMEREPEGTSQVRAANIVVIESYLQKKRIKEIDSYST